MSRDDAIRERHAQADAADEYGRDDTPPDRGAARVCGATVRVGTYPTTARCFYAVEEYDLSGDEVEGGPGTETATGRIYYAFNHGTAIPPEGTKVVLTEVPHRWTFRY